MSQDSMLDHAYDYWRLALSIVDEHFTAEDDDSETLGISPYLRNEEDREKDDTQISLGVLAQKMPEVPEELARSREFLDIALQYGESASLKGAAIFWSLIVPHIGGFRDAVRLLSQMHSRTYRRTSGTDLAEFLYERILIPLIKRFKARISKPIIILASEICIGTSDIGERMKLSGSVFELLRRLSPSVRRRRFGPALFIKLADLLVEDDRFREASAIAKIGLIFFPHTLELMLYRTERSYGENYFDRQPSELDRIIELFPSLPEYRKLRGMYYFEREEYGKALKDIQAFLEENPDDHEARAMYALTLSSNYRPVDALEEYRTLIAANPGEAKYFLFRAKVYDQMEMSARAIDDYSKALELDPSLEEAEIGREVAALKRQAMGIDDEVYSAYITGGEERLVGDERVPSERFDDIAGIDFVKETIRETIQYPLMNPDLAKMYGKHAGGGVLFFGPPGCGKTILARAAAGECGIPFINVNLSTVLDKWVGNTEKAIAMIFKVARKNTPSMIFFDELDALGMAREDTQTGWEKKLISQLLTEMDGTQSSNLNVMILGATNAPWNVDLALRRAGRFGKSVYVPPPSLKERADIFNLYLKKRPFVDLDGIDSQALAKKTEYHSSDSIRQIVEDAASIPWKEAIRTGESRPIEMRDLDAAIEARQPDLNEWHKLVSKYEDFARQTQAKRAIGFKHTRQKPQQV